MIRRAAYAGLAIAAALVQGAVAADPATLDGHRKTSYSYDGVLTGPTVYSGITETGTSGGLKPQREWCTEQTCDTTDLALRLPAGRQSGRLVVELAYAPSASMRLGIYRADGTELPSPTYCCMSDRVVATQLPAGSYSVVVYDEVGSGRFNVTVSWKANPPHRSAGLSGQE